MPAEPFDPLLSRFNSVSLRHAMTWLAGIYLVVLGIGYLRFDEGRGILARLLMLLFVSILPLVFGSWLVGRLPSEAPSAEEWDNFRTREYTRRRQNWYPVRVAYVLRFVYRVTIFTMALLTPAVYAVFVLIIPHEIATATVPDMPPFLTWFGVAAACSLLIALGKVLTQTVQAARYWKRSDAAPPAA